MAMITCTVELRIMCAVSKTLNMCEKIIRFKRIRRMVDKKTKHDATYRRGLHDTASDITHVSKADF